MNVVLVVCFFLWFFFGVGVYFVKFVGVWRVVVGVVGVGVVGFGWVLLRLKFVFCRKLFVEEFWGILSLCEGNVLRFVVMFMVVFVEEVCYYCFMS